MVQEVNRQFVDNVPGFHCVGLAGNGADGAKFDSGVKTRPCPY